ncbi:MAG: AI-2E family transporter [Chloroflexi bacterium]|nr:MAG: AI-2E family transporter [Chloroflexota bacterium]
MQARRTIHVAERSTAFMGLQFNDPSYNRPMSTGGGEPRRLISRLPSAFWVGGGLLLLLLITFLARQIILPFLLAIFLTYLLLPLVNAMTEPGPGGRRTPRVLAVFLAVATFIGVLVVAILVLAPLLAGEANRLGRVLFGTGGQEPQIAHRLSATFQDWRNTIYGAGVFPPSVQESLDQEARDFVSGLGDAAAAAVSASLTFFPKLLELIAVPLLTFYMLLDGPRLMREIRSFLPSAQQHPAAELMRRWDRVLSEYVRGQLIISLFIGVVVTLGLRAMGLKAALLVGTIAFFIEAIPFFGPLIWGTLAVLLALAQSPAGSPLPLIVAIFALVAQQVDSHLVAPLILGRFTKVHPLLLIFSTLLGASLFGLIGMFLAAPVTAVAKETFLFVMERVQARRGAASLTVSA